MKEISLYVHLPFCVQKCAYCDFLSFPAMEEEKRTYLTVLEAEMIQTAPLVRNRPVCSVFFGGGTPSILQGEQIAALLQVIREHYELKEQAEITLEANPGTVTKEKLMCYKHAGINRLSLGLQSADNQLLKTLGRVHTYEQFLDSFALARASGFSNISVDLMSGLPGQTLRDWTDTLEKVIALEPEHISAYSLIIEEGTPFFERYQEDFNRQLRGEKTQLLPEEETERQMVHHTQRDLLKAGYHQYEISNFAKSGYESVHNVGYWIRREYLGFGLGAASLLGNERLNNTRQMEEYLAYGREAASREMLTREDIQSELMFLGLRMTKGVSKQQFYEQTGRCLNECYAEEIHSLMEQGLLEESDTHLYLTPFGLDVSNYCMAQFV